MIAFSHYNLLDEIGTGALGDVHRARDTKHGRTVAIKIVPASIAGDPRRRMRFLADARRAAAVSHPNVATLFDIVQEGDRLYLVFEYVAGQPLRAVIGGRPLSVRRAIDLAVQIADALADAHAAGLVHGDLKPDNVLVSAKGNAKLLDTGLSDWTGGGTARAAAARRSAPPGTVLRTLAYLSPEQVEGRPVDGRSDIFSLGVMLFEMLTGRSPFARPTGPATAAEAARAVVPPASTLNPGVPAELDELVRRGLAADPDARFQSAASLAAELRSIAAILDVRAEAAGAGPTVVMAPRGRRTASILVLAGLLIAIAAGAWLMRGEVARLWHRAFGPPPMPVVAVMPLDHAGGDRRAYFADGLMDDIVARLGQVPGITVVGRSAIRDRRGRDARAVAREMEAGVLLAGAMAEQDGALSVTVELLDAADGRRRWSGTYRERPERVLALQEQIAGEVARALGLPPAPDQARARTASRLVQPPAYDLYLRGRERAAQCDPEGAAALFERAVETDPALAEAHAALAEAVYVAEVRAGRPPSADPRLARAAASAASIDPDLPGAQLARGLAASSSSLAEALQHMGRAVEIDPSFAAGYLHIARLVGTHDPPRAREFRQAALELDARLGAPDGCMGQ